MARLLISSFVILSLSYYLYSLTARIQLKEFDTFLSHLPPDTLRNCYLGIESARNNLSLNSYPLTVHESDQVQTWLPDSGSDLFAAISDRLTLHDVITLKKFRFTTHGDELCNVKQFIHSFIRDTEPSWVAAFAEAWMCLWDGDHLLDPISFPYAFYVRRKHQRVATFLYGRFQLHLDASVTIESIYAQFIIGGG